MHNSFLLIGVYSMCFLEKYDAIFPNIVECQVQMLNLYNSFGVDPASVVVKYSLRNIYTFILPRQPHFWSSFRCVSNRNTFSHGAIISFYLFLKVFSRTWPRSGVGKQQGSCVALRLHCSLIFRLVALHCN